MENTEILSNLKILGLEAGAGHEEIHSAFRKLAHELHPDITGSKSDWRFKKITGAYTALKNVTPEELAGLEELVKKIHVGKPKLKRDIYDYYSAEKKRRADDKIVNSILDKYEQEIKKFNDSSNGNGDGDFDMEAFTFRLKSKNLKVVAAALKHSASLAGRVEFRLALVEVLKRPDINGEPRLAEIIASLPIDGTNKKLIAFDVSDNAGKFPTGLIIALSDSDPDVMENFLLHVKPDDVAVLLRRWPSHKAMGTNVIRHLLESDEPAVLVPMLGLMQTRFPSSASVHLKRLRELESHSSAAVRAWAKKLGVRD